MERMGMLLGRKHYLQLSELHHNGCCTLSHFSNEETILKNMRCLAYSTRTKKSPHFQFIVPSVTQHWVQKNDIYRIEGKVILIPDFLFFFHS